MQTTWVVGDADQIVTLPLPLTQGYFTYGGSVYGNETFAPSVYHYFDGTSQCGPAEDVAD
jgi:hypothetical protein